MPVHHHPDIDIQSQAVNYDRYVHPCQLSYSGNGANGFMVISDGAEVETMSSKLEVGKSYLIHVPISKFVFFNLFCKY